MNRCFLIIELFYFYFFYFISFAQKNTENNTSGFTFVNADRNIFYAALNQIAVHFNFFHCYSKYRALCCIKD